MSTRGIVRVGCLQTQGDVEAVISNVPEELHRPQSMVYLQVSYLKRLFPLIRQLGATGVLLEWEDMFPFSGPLSFIAAGNSYSRQEVEDILTAARGSELEVIPLVQTFGHVEFALKHPEFAGLREVPESPQALCPSLNASLDFVEKLIEQVRQPYCVTTLSHGIHYACGYLLVDYLMLFQFYVLHFLCNRITYVKFNTNLLPSGFYLFINFFDVFWP